MAKIKMLKGLQFQLEKKREELKIVVDGMVETLYHIIQKNGGEVDMSDEGADGAYSVEYTFGKEAIETRITRVRTGKNGLIEFQTEHWGDEWINLRYGEHDFLKALTSIAENIYQFVPEEYEMLGE